MLPCHDAYLFLHGFISFFFCLILMLVSLLPGAINQGLCFAPSSDSSVLLLYLFTFWWGSHRPTYVCGERNFNFFYNFPALMWIGGMCGEQREDADVDSIEWQMKNGCEIDARVWWILRRISHRVSSRLHICETRGASWRIRVQRHYLFFILRLKLESKSTIWSNVAQRNRDGK